MSAATESAEWIGRGRAHQWEGRPVDAMLCFRRASRADPRAPDPHFVLGEVLWQLGRFPDAIAAWRDASRLDPNYLAPVQALSEALLATGDAAGAIAAAERVRTLAPGNARAEMIGGIARMMAGNADADPLPAAAVAGAVAREPALTGVATLAGPLALALDAAPDTPARAELLACLARSPDARAAAPLLLVALALEHAVADSGADVDAIRAALVAAARTREYPPAEHDALRRIAVAAARFDRAAATELARRYAKLCAHTMAAPVPPGWPRRTAGGRTRVAVLVPSDGAAAVAAVAALPRDAFGLTVMTIGVPDFTLPENVAAFELPRVPDAAAARVIAAQDPDVLVDLAGMMAAIGSLLAQRPARATWTLTSLALPNESPLVDRTFDDPGALAEALVALHAARDPAAECPLDAAAMATAWTDAVRAHQQGDRAGALTRYARALLLQPGFAPAHYLSGIVQRDEGSIDAARGAFAAALIAAPGYVDARLAAASAATAAGDAETAAALCDEGLERTPADSALLRALGHAHLARHDGAAATAAFARALRTDMTDGATHYNLGVALQMQRYFGEAARAYQRALAFRPDLVAAHFNLGVLFQEQGATDAALAAYGEVLAADAGNVAARKNIGEALLAAGRVDAFVDHFLNFEAACPDALPLAVQALVACQYRGDFAMLERYLEGLRHERFAARDDADLVDCVEELLYLLLYFDVPPAMLDHYARIYDAAARRVYGEPLSRPAERRPGRLRIGYLSADLRNHVMGKMVWSALEHHDRARFELFFYSLSSADDDWTAKFRGLADRFEVIEHMPERVAATRIAEDDLDILVDLSTHTKGARPGILARKPARVQITHVASAGAVGLSTIDFKLTDRFADVPENQPFQIETLLPIDGCVYPYRHVAAATAHPFQRAPLGIAADAIVIGAFVSAQKLSRRCLLLWRDVLARVPRARLAFSPVNPALRGVYERLAAAIGIAPDRVLFVPQGRDDAENQARYHLVDFVLDPMPYGGVNGTLEALDMGVPVVTLVGKRHGERTSFSILSNLGVTDTIAASGRDYVDLAGRLADDPSFMRDVRERIRAGIANSALVDTRAHTRALESAYLAALESKAPAALAAADERADG